MFKALSIAIVAVTVAFSAATVEAKKFGGGKSVGTQRSSVADQKANPSAASTAATPAAAAAAAPAAAAAAAKPSLMSRMAGPLAGIAAGLGLAYLFSKMGAGGFLGFLLIAGLVIAALVWFGRKAMQKQQPAAAGGAPMPFGTQQPSAPASQYAGSASGGSSAAAPVATGLAGGFGIPAGFDKAGFEENAKKQFMAMQAANDKGDLDEVRNFATDEFYNQIAKDVVGGNKDATHVDELHANLLGIETDRGQYWASVEFTGKMREDGMVMGSAFSEVWNLVKPVDGSKGWLVAGIQQV
ncbi:MAG: Tim44-like domain-containing protein [Casimicrobium sp.]